MFFRIIVSEYKSLFGKNSIIKSLLYYWLYNEFRVKCFVRQIVQSSNSYVKLLRIGMLERRYTFKVGINAIIGKNLKIAHYCGTIIGGGTIIGDNCTIYHQVTIGQINSEYPVIGNNVMIFPGAKIIGGIQIGDNVIIGPNSVVIKDVPKNTIVSGVPAKTIKEL